MIQRLLIGGLAIALLLALAGNLWQADARAEAEAAHRIAAEMAAAENAAWADEHAQSGARRVCNAWFASDGFKHSGADYLRHCTSR